MKIYAICVVKNESDIIEVSLSKALEWADKIIVFDNGSTDGTWEKVQGLDQSKIIPFKQDDRPYSDGLRAQVFDAFSSELENGDWWVVQDADEIYYDNPRHFILNNQGHYHHINGKKVDFCFDLSKVDELQFKGDFAVDKDMFTYYTPEAWSEPRLIKHRIGMKWTEKNIWPKHMGLVCLKPIRIMHFPLRSHQQMKARWEIRNNLSRKGGQFFQHWEKQEWSAYYKQKAKTFLKVTDYDTVFREVKMANNFRQSLLKRIAKLILHGTRIIKTLVIT